MRKTIRKELELLRGANLIRFESSPKAGRYVLTSMGKQQVISKIVGWENHWLVQGDTEQ